MQQQKNRFMRFIISLALAVLILPCAAQTYSELSKTALEHYKKKDYKKAATFYAKAAENATNNTEKVHALAQQGQALVIAGKEKEAAQVYAAALEIDNTSLPLLMQRANLLLQIDSVQSAIDCYNKIEKAMPDNRDILFFRAYAYTIQQKYDKAKKDYIALLAKTPNDTAARLGLALLYHKEGSSNESAMLFECMLEEQPMNDEIYAARCNVEIENKQYELALFDIEKAIEIAPRKAEYHNTKADILTALGRKKAASRSRSVADKLMATPSE